jgi:hypothetical protein
VETADDHHGLSVDTIQKKVRKRPERRAANAPVDNRIGLRMFSDELLASRDSIEKSVC